MSANSPSQRSRPRTLNEYFSQIRPGFSPNVLQQSLDPAQYPVYSVVREAAVLFVDIPHSSNLVNRYEDLNILFYYVNHWLTRLVPEGLFRYGALLDKYIGDEVMLIFPNDVCYGSPLEAAVRTAKLCTDFDDLGTRPRAGIAFGEVAIGLMGPIGQDEIPFEELTYVTATGPPVNLASRCVTTISRDFFSYIRIAHDRVEDVEFLFNQGLDPCRYGIERGTVNARNIGDINVINIYRVRD